MRQTDAQAAYQRSQSQEEGLPLFGTTATTKDTRRENFLAMKAKGDDKVYREKILDFMRRDLPANFTNLELATALGLPINCITSPVLELRQAGKLIEGQRRNCRISGHKAIAWRLA